MKYVKGFFEYLLNFLIGLLIFGAVFLKHYFKRATITEYLFSILTPATGTDRNFYIRLVVFCILPSLIIAAVMFFIRKKFKINVVIYIPMLLLSIGFFGGYVGVFKYIDNNLTDSSFIEDNYIAPSNTEITFKNKKNLIYILLESMENTYASVECGGAKEHNLIPNLTNIANEHISFSNTDKLGGALHLEGSSDTIDSLLCQFAGIPLKIDITMAFKYDFTKFYTGTALGDILYNNGYKNYLIMGADSRFGNENCLFQNQHFSVSDVNTAIDKGYMTKDDIVFWGYSDKDLFKYARQDLEKISKDDAPFCYMIETIDTHTEDGYLEDDCKIIYEDQYSNVINNSDTLIFEFLNWLKQQDFYDDTVVVLVGDHLSMDADFFNNVPSDYIRTTYNAFINADAKPTNTKNRLFTQLDMFPTLISAMGGKIKGERLGLGTNLFSSEQTLVEKYGYDYVRSELNKRSVFCNSLMGQR